MPHKIALIPVQSAKLDVDFVFQTALRSIGAYATQRRHQKWHESIEYACLVHGGVGVGQFAPFRDVDPLRQAFKEMKPVDQVEVTIKKAIYDALSLSWSADSGLLSPVKKKSAGVSHSQKDHCQQFKWIRTILLIGDFDDDQVNGKEMLTNQILKQLRANDIRLVYISDKSTNSPFPPATVKAIPSAHFPTKVKSAV